jgi:hypothetical protein
VAIPRYTATVTRAEAAAENAVISSIRAGLETYATEQLMEHGRREWPIDPFDALNTNPSGWVAKGTGNAAIDGEWKYNTTTGADSVDGTITHMRGNNDVKTWNYDDGVHTPKNEETGSLGARNP